MGYKGMCKECYFSRRTKKLALRKSYQWCGHYSSWCYLVSRNCKGPVILKAQKDKRGEG